MDRQEDSGGSSPDMDAFLTLGWHGAHQDESGVGNDPDIYQTVDIVDEVVGGKFGLYFCSTTCLRNFLSARVDKLEQKN